MFVLLWTMGSWLGAQPTVLWYSANPQYPPYHWAQGNALVGASVELLHLALPPGVEARPVVAPWPRVLEMARTGEIDLILSLRITPERQGYLRFTTHRSFPNPIRVFTRAGSGLTLPPWSNLREGVGGVSLGDTFGGGFDEYWPHNLKVETAPTMVENFRKLVAGRIDWFVTSGYLGQAYVASRGLANVVTLDPPISDLDIHFGFSRRSAWADWEPQVSQTLARLDSEGTLDALLARFLGAAAHSPPGSFAGE